MSHWTPEQFEYYNSLGFPATYEKVSRRWLYDEVKKHVMDSEGLRDAIGKAFMSEKQARKRLAHWFSVFMSRSQVFMHTDYEKCKHQRDEEHVAGFN